MYFSHQSYTFKFKFKDLLNKNNKMSELSKLIISTILEPKSKKTPEQIMGEFEQEMQDVVDYIKEWKHNKLIFIEENNKKKIKM